MNAQTPQWRDSGAPGDLLIVQTFAREWLRARAAREDAQHRLELITEQLIELMPVGAVCELEPGLGVKVQAGSRRIDVNLVAKYLDAREIAEVSKAVIDPALVRARYPALVDDLTRDAGPFVRALV
jgi:hypothetical protein